MGCQELRGGIFDQQCHNEMREQPAAGECLASDRQPVDAEQSFEALEREFNGLIANDKFCWARTLQLHLTWSRARNKLKGPAPRHLSAEAVPHGAEHAAEAHLARPADRRADGGRPAALGPGLPASPYAS